MAKLSKRAKVIREKVDPNKAYSLEEAVSLLSGISVREAKRAALRKTSILGSG